MIDLKRNTLWLFLVVLSVVLVRTTYSQSLEPRKPADWNVCKPIAASETNWQIVTEGYECQAHYGKREDALHFARKALEIAERDLGTDHANTETSVHNVAYALWSMKNFTEAEPFFKRAVTIDEKHMDDSLQEVLHNIASFYEDWGKYSMAEQYQKRVLALEKKKYSSHAPELTGTLNSLALIYEKQRKYSAALQTYNRSLQIEKESGQSHSSSMIYIFRRMADIHMAQRRYPMAIHAYERALKIREKNGKINDDDDDDVLLLEKLSQAYSEVSKDLLKRAQKIEDKNAVEKKHRNGT